eukprot:jgi/Ulvmu1/4681/UM002_0412.1
MPPSRKGRRCVTCTRAYDKSHTVTIVYNVSQLRDALLCGRWAFSSRLRSLVVRKVWEVGSVFSRAVTLLHTLSGSAQAGNHEHIDVHRDLCILVKKSHVRNALQGRGPATVFCNGIRTCVC